MRRRSIIKTLLFVLIAVVLVLALMEGVARLLESLLPPAPVDARTPLEFQHFDTADPFGEMDFHGKKAFFIQWSGLPFVHFLEEKAPNEFRIVLLGGSAVVGYGVPPTATFSHRMEQYLRDAAPGKNIRLLNLAQIGYASPQLAHVLKSLAEKIKPDLVLVILGNNEYLDVAAMFEKRPEKVTELEKARWIETRSAIARFMRWQFKRPTFPRAHRKIPMVKKTPEINRFVENRLERSLTEMKQTADRVGAEMVVCTVQVNRRYQTLREWSFAADGIDIPPPWKQARQNYYFGNPKGIAEAMQSRLKEAPDEIAANLMLGVAYRKLGQQKKAADQFRMIFDHFKKIQDGDLGDFDKIILAWALAESEGSEAAIARVAKWIENRPPAKGDHYNDWLAGELNFYAGNLPEARRFYDLCLNNDYGALRTDDRLNQRLMSFAQKLGASHFDLAAQVAKASPGQIPGYDIFLDYCHYNTKGHILVASLLADHLAKDHGFPGNIPNAGNEIAEYQSVMKGREIDHPDLRYWSGADFQLTRLTDEKVDYDRPTRDEIHEIIRLRGDSPIAQTYLGNWAFAVPRSPTEADRTKALRSYENALALSPEFSPAAKNHAIVQAWISSH